MNSDILNHIHAPAQPNMGLANGLKCVQLLAASPRPLGSQEIARTLGMKPTRINRMLGTLVAVGMATKTRNRKYLPGPGIHVLSAMSLSNCGILNSAFPVIEELKNRVQGYIALGVLWRTMVWYLYYGNHERSAVEAIGGFAPYDAEISSLGQILLAQQSDELIREVYGEYEFTAFDGLEAFLDHIAEAREQGYALNHMSSLAVTVGDPPIAALALAAHTNEDLKTDEALVERLPQLRDAAERITETLAAHHRELLAGHPRPRQRNRMPAPHTSEILEAAQANNDTGKAGVALA